MSRGVNKVILIGNLGDNPDVRTTPQGGVVANLSVATDESYKDKNTGQMVPKTEWHRVVLFNRLAEVARDYLKKGSKVYIEGKLQTRKWQDQGGNDRYTTEIVGNDMQMLDGKPADAGHAQGATQGYQPQNAPQQQAPQQGGYQAPQNPTYAQQAPQPQRQPQAAPQGYSTPQGAAPAAMPPTDQYDDDIPFFDHLGRTMWNIS